MAATLSFSLSAKAAAKTNGNHKSPITNGKKRSHALVDDLSDEDSAPSKQLVTHFGPEGAINEHAPTEQKGPLVIKAQANRDWREAAQAKKRPKYGIPQNDEQDARAREEAIGKIEEARKPTWGLNVKKKEVTVEAEQNDGQQETMKVEEKEEQAPVKPKTLDQQAMDALLGVKTTSDRVISAVTEEEAFQHDFRTAPPQATLAEYDAMPVEEFGAALLRGMGWKEGYGLGNQSGQKQQKAKMPERRPALLGIGAKEDAAVKEELGAWGRGAKKRSDIVYNPIVMRNKKTGEELTEQEMNERLAEQKAKDRETDLAAYAAERKAKDRGGKDRRDDREQGPSDEEYERKRRERRRERDRHERDYDRKERRRSRDRSERHDQERSDRRDRERTREDRVDRDSDRRRGDDRDRHHRSKYNRDDRDRRP